MAHLMLVDTVKILMSPFSYVISTRIYRVFKKATFFNHTVVVLVQYFDPQLGRQV